MLFDLSLSKTNQTTKTKDKDVYTHIIPVILKTKKIEPSDGRRTSGHFWVEGP